MANKARRAKRSMASTLFNTYVSMALTLFYTYGYGPKTVLLFPALRALSARRHHTRHDRYTISGTP